MPVVFLTARDDTEDKITGPDRRRRRLRDQAVQPGGGRRPDPGRPAPHRRRRRARHRPARLRTTSSSTRTRHEVRRGRQARRPVADRVQAAALPHAQRRTGCCRRRRSSTTSGPTTSTARPASSSPTSPTCAARSTPSSPPLIHTMRGVGYVLRLPPRLADATPDAVGRAAGPGRACRCAPGWSAILLVALVAALVAHRAAATQYVAARLPGRPARRPAAARRRSAARVRGRPATATAASRPATACRDLAVALRGHRRRRRHARSGRDRRPVAGPAHPVVRRRRRPTSWPASRYTSASADGTTQWRAVVARRPRARQRRRRLVVVAAPAGRASSARSPSFGCSIARLGGIVVVVCALLGWLAIRRSFQPLVEVEQTAAAIAAGDLSRRIPERPTDDRGRPARPRPSTGCSPRSSRRSGPGRPPEDAHRGGSPPTPRTSCAPRSPRSGASPSCTGRAPSRPDDVPRTMRRIEDEATPDGRARRGPPPARPARRSSAPAKAEPVDLAVLAGDAVHDARGAGTRPARAAGRARRARGPGARRRHRRRGRACARS